MAEETPGFLTNWRDWWNWYHNSSVNWTKWWYEHSITNWECFLNPWTLDIYGPDTDSPDKYTFTTANYLIEGIQVIIKKKNE